MFGMIGNLLGIAEQYLTLRNTKESRVYLDRLIYLRRELHVEENKSDDVINHARIDNLNSELRILLESIASFGKTNP